MIRIVLSMVLVGGCDAHPVPVAICVSLGVLVILLGRQHVARQYAARQRAIVEANAEPPSQGDDEIADEVTDTPGDVGEVVAQLATQPIQLVDERVVDDRYVIIGRLGSGRSAIVYEVERIGDAKRFAMKQFRDRADARRTARFAREARGMADPLHPNLVPVIDVGIVDGVNFVVMPIVDGGSLLAHEGRFGDRAWAEWMLGQVAAALAELHARGVLHRDVRAANVLVSAGQAKLADAGLAVLALPAPTAGDAVTVAPELARGEPATEESDVFALGLLAQDLFGAEPLPDVIARCLAEDPAERPSAADVAAALAIGGPLSRRA